jgi:hypothetical protein
MVTVTNEVFQWVFLFKRKTSYPIPSMIHLKTGEGVPSVLLLFVTKCIILHRIQYTYFGCLTEKETTFN